MGAIFICPNAIESDGAQFLFRRTLTIDDFWYRWVADIAATERADALRPVFLSHFACTLPPGSTGPNIHQQPVPSV
jgi:hypothetical protein